MQETQVLCIVVGEMFGQQIVFKAGVDGIQGTARTRKATTRAQKKGIMYRCNVKKIAHVGLCK